MKKHKSRYNKYLRILSIALVAVTLLSLSNLSAMVGYAESSTEGEEPSIADSISVQTNESAPTAVGHQHNFACYEQWWPVCGYENGDPTTDGSKHYHTWDCFEYEGELMCELQVGDTTHVHSDACIEVANIYTCGVEYHKHDHTCIDPNATKMEAHYVYNVNYDAAGGYNAPNKQIVDSYEESAVITISDSEPLRGGYKFSGWVDEKGDTYSAGQQVTLTKDAPTLNLQATWTIDRGEETIEDGLPLASGSASRYYCEKEEHEHAIDCIEKVYMCWYHADVEWDEDFEQDSLIEAPATDEGNDNPLNFTVSWSGEELPNCNSYVDEDGTLHIEEATQTSYNTYVNISFVTDRTYEPGEIQFTVPILSATVYNTKGTFTPLSFSGAVSEVSYFSSGKAYIDGVPSKENIGPGYLYTLLQSEGYKPIVLSSDNYTNVATNVATIPGGTHISFTFLVGLTAAHPRYQESLDLPFYCASAGTLYKSHLSFKYIPDLEIQNISRRRWSISDTISCVSTYNPAESIPSRVFFYNDNLTNVYNISRDKFIEDVVSGEWNYFSVGFSIANGCGDFSDFTFTLGEDNGLEFVGAGYYCGSPSTVVTKSLTRTVYGVSAGLVKLSPVFREQGKQLNVFFILRAPKDGFSIGSNNTISISNTLIVKQNLHMYYDDSVSTTIDFTLDSYAEYGKSGSEKGSLRMSSTIQHPRMWSMSPLEYGESARITDSVTASYTYNCEVTPDSIDFITGEIICAPYTVDLLVDNLYITSDEVATSSNAVLLEQEDYRFYKISIQVENIDINGVRHILDCSDFDLRLYCRVAGEWYDYTDQFIPGQSTYTLTCSPLEDVTGIRAQLSSDLASMCLNISCVPEINATDRIFNLIHGAERASLGLMGAAGATHDDDGSIVSNSGAPTNFALLNLVSERDAVLYGQAFADKRVRQFVLLRTPPREYVMYQERIYGHGVGGEDVPVVNRTALTAPTSCVELDLSLSDVLVAIRDTDTLKCWRDTKSDACAGTRILLALPADIELSEVVYAYRYNSSLNYTWGKIFLSSNLNEFFTLDSVTTLVESGCRSLNISCGKIGITLDNLAVWQIDAVDPTGDLDIVSVLSYSGSIRYFLPLTVRLVCDKGTFPEGEWNIPMALQLLDKNGETLSLNDSLRTRYSRLSKFTGSGSATLPTYDPIFPKGDEAFLHTITFTTPKSSSVTQAYIAAKTDGVFNYASYINAKRNADVTHRLRYTNTLGTSSGVVMYMDVNAAETQCNITPSTLWYPAEGHSTASDAKVFTSTSRVDMVKWIENKKGAVDLYDTSSGFTQSTSTFTYNAAEDRYEMQLPANTQMIAIHLPSATFDQGETFDFYVDSKLPAEVKVPSSGGSPQHKAVMYFTDVHDGGTPATGRGNTATVVVDVGALGTLNVKKEVGEKFELAEKDAQGHVELTIVNQTEMPHAVLIDAELTTDSALENIFICSDPNAYVLFSGYGTTLDGEPIDITGYEDRIPIPYVSEGTHKIRFGVLTIGAAVETGLRDEHLVFTYDRKESSSSATIISTTPVVDATPHLEPGETTNYLYELTLSGAVPYSTNTALLYDVVETTTSEYKGTPKLVYVGELESGIYEDAGQLMVSVYAAKSRSTPTFTSSGTISGTAYKLVGDVVLGAEIDPLVGQSALTYETLSSWVGKNSRTLVLPEGTQSVAYLIKSKDTTKTLEDQALAERFVAYIGMEADWSAGGGKGGDLTAHNNAVLRYYSGDYSSSKTSNTTDYTINFAEWDGIGELPDSGGCGIYALIATGIVLSTAAATSLVYRRKRKAKVK